MAYVGRRRCLWLASAFLITDIALASQHVSCKPKSTGMRDAGYPDAYRGWYDVQGCGKCFDYCRWVGSSGSGGDPSKRTEYAGSYWSCRPAGTSKSYTIKKFFSDFSYTKCTDGEGGRQGLPPPPAPSPPRRRTATPRRRRTFTSVDPNTPAPAATPRRRRSFAYVDPNTMPPEEKKGVVWGVDSWYALILCQVFFFFLLFVDFIVRPRFFNYLQVNQIVDTRRRIQLRTFWKIGEFLAFCGLLFVTKKLNEEKSPRYWYLPIVFTIGLAVVIMTVLKKFFPDTHAKIFAVRIKDEETDDGDPPAVESLPDYWTNKKLRKPVNFDQMVYVQAGNTIVFDNLLRECYEPIATRDRACPKDAANECPSTPGGCPCVQVGGTPGLPTAYVARRIIRNEDSSMWQRYDARREVIATNRKGENFRNFDPPVKTANIVDQNPGVFQPLNHEINEVYLWHGTSVRVALHIAQNDFRIDLAGSNKGTMYGKGAYLCESSTKCDEYAKDDPDGYYGGIRALVLCRVVMGKFYYTQNRDESAGKKAQNGEYDGTLGDRAAAVNTFREFVVYDPDQLYPEYIILYSRAHGQEEENGLREAAKIPFLMELPLYWANCHNDIKTSPFDEEYRIRDSAKDVFQQLAQATRSSGSSVQVLEVVRMEDSKMWDAYQNFKHSLSSNKGGGKIVAPMNDLERGNNNMIDNCKQMADIHGGESLTQREIRKLDAEDCISLENLDARVNELLLWHGSSEAAVDAISKDGFIIPRGDRAKHGKRFGEGAYFAEDLQKSFQYVQSDSSGCYWFLLCRAIMGEPYVTTERSEVDAHEKAKEKGKHSILACPSDEAREFIVLEECQVYPEFVVKMRASR